MIIYGIQNFKGEKNGRSYNFSIVHVLDKEYKSDNLRGWRVRSLQAIPSLDLSGIELGKDYQCDTFYSNGRDYLVGIVK